MRAGRARLVGVVVVAAFAIGIVACAGLVGADFDVHLASDAGPDAGGPKPPVTDSGGTKTLDASGPVVVADGGACPTGLTNCGGLCFDVTTNPAHCGKCSTTCPGDPNGAAVCVSSHCAFACDQGWLECAGGCCSVASDASTPPTVDAGPPPGTDASAPQTSGITCASALCPVASNSFCCGMTGGDVCDTNPADTCAADIFCDDTAQCAGTGVCCFDPTMATPQALCASACTTGQKQMCDPAAADCPSGQACTGTLSPSGGTQYSVCQ